MKPHRPLLIYGLAIVLTAVFVGEVLYPISVLGIRSVLVGGNVSFERFRSLLDPSNAGNVEAVRNSVVVSVLSILLSGMIGIFFAFVFSQLDFPLKRILSRLAILPIALPPLVGVLAFLFVFGQTGILPRLLQRFLGTATIPVSLDGPVAILAVHVYSFYVYFYLFVSDSLRTLDGSLIEASVNLGATPWRVFRSVVLPHVRPALLAASALTFMASMASFSAPLVFAGRHRFITLQIYYTKLNGDMDLAAAQSLLLLLLSALFFVVLTFARGKETGSRQMKGATRGRLVQVGRRTRVICIGMTWVLMALCVLPLLAIIQIGRAHV
jgi:iron(III) transport system permease protein